MVGPNWPNDGEIDIIEGVNLNTYDTVTLHTASGCVPTVGSGGQTGTSGGESDCGAGGGYTGCSVTSNDATSYGTAFNANGGGVYAMLWTSSAIEVWYFAAADIPSDITDGNPDPSGWPTPTANWAGCDFDDFFIDLQIASTMNVEKRNEGNMTDDAGRFLISRFVGHGPVRFGAHRHARQ